MQIPQAIADEFHSALIRFTPTAAMVGVSASGWGPQAIIWALTGLLLTLQIGYLVWKWRREARAKTLGD